MSCKDHPVCAASEASQHFLDGAATPPHEEGTTLTSDSCPIVKLNFTVMIRCGICGFASITIVLLALSSDSSARTTAMQNRAPGPSFSCANATTNTEKLICADQGLSALDDKYARLYNQRLRETGKSESDAIKRNAEFQLQFRE